MLISVAEGYGDNGFEFFLRLSLSLAVQQRSDAYFVSLCVTGEIYSSVGTNHQSKLGRGHRLGSPGTKNKGFRMVLDHAQDRAVSDAERYPSDAPRKFAKGVAVVKSFLETLWSQSKEFQRPHGLLDFSVVDSISGSHRSFPLLVMWQRSNGFVLFKAEMLMQSDVSVRTYLSIGDATYQVRRNLKWDLN